MANLETITGRVVRIVEGRGYGFILRDRRVADFLSRAGVRTPGFATLRRACVLRHGPGQRQPAVR